MANRKITDPTLLNTVDNQTVTYYELVSFDVGDGYYLTNAPFDIAYAGDTYRAFGQLLGFDSVEENVQLEIATLKITVSGIAAYEDGSTPAEDFLQEDYANKPVYIYRTYFNDNGVIGTVEIYRGYITGATIQLAEDDVTSVQVETASHWIDFGRRAGRFTNNESQQHFYPGDIGLEYCSELQKEVEWK